jgi:hypothetical protein
MARRAEERVDDRARGGGVQPVLQGNACDPGVPKVFWDDKCSYGDAGGQITAQPSTLVEGQPFDDRQEAGEPSVRSIVGSHRQVRDCYPLVRAEYA